MAVELIEEGFYIVLLPNGTPWGSARLAHEVVALLSDLERSQVVVAPDPADGSGEITYRHVSTHTVPFAS